VVITSGCLEPLGTGILIFTGLGMSLNVPGYSVEIFEHKKTPAEPAGVDVLKDI